MTVNTVTGASSTNLSSVVSTQTLGKQDFLKLLVAQLQHQDPLAPTDNTQFVAQLAQFSSLEQEQNINSGVSQLASNQQTTFAAQATELVGKRITATSTAITMNAGSATPLSFSLANPSSVTTAKIYDANGKLVRSLALGAQGAGQQTVAWDGKDSAGSTLADGAYTVQMSATDANQTAVGVSQTLTGVVTGVDLSGGYVQLRVGSAEVTMSQITNVE